MNQDAVKSLYHTGGHVKTTYLKIVAHSLLFFVQSLVFTLHNAIYFEIFNSVGVINKDESEKVPEIVGYLMGAFFVGKLLSDPLWGWVRDRIGDKKTLTIISILLFLSLVAFGLSNSMTTLTIFIGCVGFNCGVLVVGNSFSAWIEPRDRDKLSIWIYVFSGAGGLVGPSVGSILINSCPEPKVLYTYGSVGFLMLIITAIFLCLFHDVNSDTVKAHSHYSKFDDGDGLEIIPIQPVEADSSSNYIQNNNFYRSKWRA